MHTCSDKECTGNKTSYKRRWKHMFRVWRIFLFEMLVCFKKQYVGFWTKMTSVQYFCVLSHSPYQKQQSFLLFFKCPQFSSHPAYLSTRPVVFKVRLGDRAEATAACLITFPLKAWSHSRTFVFYCMASDGYFSMWIRSSLSFDWKNPVNTSQRSVLHRSCRFNQREAFMCLL